MKTKLYILMMPKFQVFAGFFFACLLPLVPAAQELEQLISAKLEVIDEQDHQIHDCNTYEFEDELLYDNPNVVRLYENEYYRFDYRFSYFGEQGIINPQNYLKKFYSVTIPESQGENYRITAISPSGEKVSIYAIATGKPNARDTFRIQLLDDKAELLADAIFPLEVQSDDPDGVTTAYMPYKIEYKPIYITLEDVDNPNNRIERQLLPFGGDTINIDAREAFNLLTEIEEQVQISGQSYVLVADHEKDYGYRVNFSWQGKGLQYKPGSRNGLKSYLTTVPGRDRPSSRPILSVSEVLAADLQKAGLDQKGKRVQQQYTFVAPNTNLKKVYQGNYIRQNPNAIRSRSDQRRLQYMVRENMPKVQYEMKEANRKILKYYQLNQATKTQIQTINKANAGKYQIQKMEQAKPAGKANAATTNPQVKREATLVRPNQNVALAQPRYEVARVPATPGPKGNYYTLAIELSRTTDMMAYRTYFLTFRVID